MRWLIVLTACSALLTGCGREPDLETYWAVPDFSLTDQAGQTVTLDDLKGKVWAADFFFTTCPGLCTMLSASMQDLDAALQDAEHHDRLRLVGFSLDPDTDTVERLAEYGLGMGAQPGWWYLLRGDKEVIWQLSNDGFKLSVEDTPNLPSSPISHTGKIVLVDQDGLIRGFYNGLDSADMQRLARDMKRLADG